MHWKDLRALGETEQRLYSLDAWRKARNELRCSFLSREMKDLVEIAGLRALVGI